MKTALSLALIGALVAGPAFARGMQHSSSQSQMQSGQSQMMHGQQSSMNSEMIRDVQQKLQQQGYNVNVDGKMGKQTHAALRQFQQDQGIQGSGQLNQQTMAALGVERGSMQQAQTPEQGRTRMPVQPQQPMPQQQPNYQGGGMNEPMQQQQPGGMNR
ncbi:MAG: peptidoglycan-binding domain-containing protein [Actinomycetota bacterium]